MADGRPADRAREVRARARDAKSKKQLKEIHKLMQRDDVDRIVNACDAGREGELIFSYIYELSGVDKPVDRLWISSMTKQAIKDGFDSCAGQRARRPRAGGPLAQRGRLARRHERDPRRDAPRPRVGRRRRLARPGADADARDDGEARARDPGVHARSRTGSCTPRSTRATPASGSRATRRASSATPSARRRSSRRCKGKDGVVESVERKEQKEIAPLLYDLTSLQRDANRRYGFCARRTLQAAQSLYEGKKAITYPRTSSRYISGDMVPQLKPTAGTLLPIPDYADGAQFVLDLAELPLARVVNDARVERPPRDHPDRRRARHRATSRPTSAASSTSSQALPRRLPPAGALPAHDGDHRRRGGAVPHARQDHARAGWRGVYGLESEEEKIARQEEEGADDSTRRDPAARAGTDRALRRGGGRGEGDEAAAPLHRGDAPLGDGDRRQADRRRGAPRGDEGVAGSAPRRPAPRRSRR